MSENRMLGPRHLLVRQAVGPSAKERTEKWSVVLLDEPSCEGFQEFREEGREARCVEDKRFT